MCLHKWSKWEQYKWSGGEYLYGTTIVRQITESREKRKCLKCGKMQDRKIEGT